MLAGGLKMIRIQKNLKRDDKLDQIIDYTFSGIFLLIEEIY